MKNNIIFLLALTALFTYSCDLGGEPDIGGTATEVFAGEWWVNTSLDGQVLLEHERIMTYNTASNDPNELWVDDLDHIWPFKVKVNSNVTALRFHGQDLFNEYDPSITVNVIEGFVFKGQGISRSGNTTDSIFMRVAFSDDPGNEYIIAGHQRTGFLEDEY